MCGAGAELIGGFAEESGHTLTFSWCPTPSGAGPLAWLPGNGIFLFGPRPRSVAGHCKSMGIHADTTGWRRADRTAFAL